MALYEVTLQTLFFNQQCVNRWNYELSGTPAAVSGSFALASAFGSIGTGDPATLPPDTVIDAIRDMVSSDVDFISVSVFNVYDPVDFYTTPFPTGTAGTESGASLSPTSAYGFRTNLTRRDIRRATKRFVGAVEENVNSGGIISPVGLGLMDVVKERMGENLVYDDEGNTLSFAPVVVSREKTVNPLSGRPVYKYYPTLEEQEDHLMRSIVWEVYTTIRTQVSRQYGKGA